MFHIALPRGGYSAAAGPLCGMFSLAVLTGVAKSKDLNRALASEERLPSRTATWDELGQSQTGKVAASLWVLVTEQPVWKMINWFKIIREGNDFESWHG